MGTSSAEKLVTKQAMELHDPNGKTVCIHTVCVDQAYRRKHISYQLIETYIKHIREFPKTLEQIEKLDRISL
ncbi:hypothetical protein HK096_001980, partial [Nowakowskiella sp. JEL0078]